MNDVGVYALLVLVAFVAFAGGLATGYMLRAERDDDEMRRYERGREAMERRHPTW